MANLGANPTHRRSTPGSISLYRFGGIVGGCLAVADRSVFPVFRLIAEYPILSHGGFVQTRHQAPAPRWGRCIGVALTLTLLAVMLIATLHIRERGSVPLTDQFCMPIIIAVVSRQ